MSEIDITHSVGFDEEVCLLSRVLSIDALFVEKVWGTYSETQSEEIRN